MALRLSQFYLFSFENDDTQRLSLSPPKSFLRATHTLFLLAKDHNRIHSRTLLLPFRKNVRLV